MTTTQTPSLPVMDRLKEATQDLHTRAERHPMQAGLVRGQLPRESYAGYLAQLRTVHETLESALLALADDEPRLAAVVRTSQFRLEAIDQDLAFFAHGGGASPTSATGSLCERIRERASNQPIELLGYLYVLEGSTNGGRFIARALWSAYELSPGGEGTRYLDPYGENQTAEWGRFREDMGSLELCEEETAGMIEAASEMFDGITAIMDSLSVETTTESETR